MFIVLSSLLILSYLITKKKIGEVLSVVEYLVTIRKLLSSQKERLGQMLEYVKVNFTSPKPI